MDMLQDGQSEPYNSDFATQRELIDLSTLMSKTLENKEPGHKQNAPKPQEEKIVNDKGHRYESITYKKHLLKRHKVSDKVRSNREKSIIAQAEKHLKQTVEKELMQPKEVKDDKRDLNETQDSGFTGSGEKRKGKSEFQTLEQSGIYQLDFSSVRNEIPPVTHGPHPPSSANTERSYRARKSASRFHSGGRFRGREIGQKWRDDCDCLRCDIMRRQYLEGDLTSYHNWGNYPCMKLSKSRASSYYYDSD